MCLTHFCSVLVLLKEVFRPRSESLQLRSQTLTLFFEPEWFLQLNPVWLVSQLVSLLTMSNFDPKKLWFFLLNDSIPSLCDCRPFPSFGLDSSWLCPLGALISWFHGKISGSEAVCQLQPAEDGLFLVRESVRHPGDYVLCVSFSGEVIHYRVIYQDNKLTIDNKQYFYNLIDMIEVGKAGSLHANRL